MKPVRPGKIRKTKLKASNLLKGQPLKWLIGFSFSVILISLFSVIWFKPEVLASVKPLQNMIFSLKEKTVQWQSGRQQSNPQLPGSAKSHLDGSPGALKDSTSGKTQPETATGLSYKEFIQLNQQVYGSTGAYYKAYNIRSNAALRGFLSRQSMPLGFSPAFLEGEKLTDEAAMQREPAGWFSELGTLRVGGSYGTGSKAAMDADYWLPLWQSADTIFFTQAGVYNDQNQDVLNIGTGYRYVSNGLLIGVHGFYDQDRKDGAGQASIGFEVGKDWLKLAAGYYVPMGNWQDHDTQNPAYDLSYQLASSWDIEATAYIPQYPTLSASVSYTQWFGMVDYHDTFQGNSPPPPAADLMSNPEEISFEFGWQPFPLLETEISHSIASGNESDTEINFNISWRLGESLEQQLHNESSESQLIMNRFKKSMVERQKKKHKAYKGTYQGKPISP